MASTMRTLIYTTRLLSALLLTAAGMVSGAGRAFAHEAPDEGAEWLMADWMMLTFLLFFSTAFFVFLVVLKLGFFRNPEEAKYQVVEGKEVDYFSNDWHLQESGDSQ